MSKQEEIKQTLGVVSDIQEQDEFRKRVDFLKSYIKHSHTNGFVLGISGGVDSHVAGYMAQTAINELNQEGKKEHVFIAMRLPYGTQKDESDAQESLAFIKPSLIETVDIKSAVDSLVKEKEEKTGRPVTDFRKGNMKARLRMTAQYDTAQDYNLLVIGTDHAAEALTGFYTKFGDGGADVLPLSGLTKDQVQSIAKFVGSPTHIYTKTPTADLLDNAPQQSDETELGMGYPVLNAYLKGQEVKQADKEKIESRFSITEHKRQLPVTPFDTWWK